MASRGHSIQKDAESSFYANWLWNPARLEELVSIQNKQIKPNLVSYKIWQVCFCCHWEELRTKPNQRKFHGGT
jgi:hypothetical protein